MTQPNSESQGALADSVWLSHEHLVVPDSDMAGCSMHARV